MRFYYELIEDKVRRLYTRSTNIIYKSLVFVLSRSSIRFCFTALSIIFLLNFTVSCSNKVELRRGPYLQNQTETAVTVMWGTKGNGSTGEVEVQGIGSFEAASLDEEKFTIHKARITGLQKDTDYKYRIKTDSMIQSDWILFHTNKPKGVPFRFAMIGDTGDDPKRQEHQLNVAAQMLEVMPDLWFHTGDMAVDNCNFNGFEKVTARHFSIYQEINKSRPHYPCAGNHDLDGPDKGMHFRRSFDFPENSPSGHPEIPEVYCAAYGDIWFAALSSGGSIKSSDHKELAKSLSKGGWQYNWLKDQLENEAQNFTWKFIMHHRQSYTSSMRYTHNHNVKELLDITELCEDYGVDFIAYGHVHSLQRSKPVYRGKVDYDKGVIHIDASGGGKTNSAGSGQIDRFFTDFVCGDRFGFFIGDVTYNGDMSTLTLTCIDEYGEVINSETGSSGIWSKIKKAVNPDS